MARHEDDFRGSAKELPGLNELLELLGNKAEGEGRSREDAIACYLSGGEGWREAMELLGGTFAGEGIELRDGKKD